MIRVLVMIAVTGFFVSLVTLSTAVALGGPDIFEHVAWNGFGHGHWNINDDDWSWRSDRGDRHSGPQTTRELAWNGSDTLEVEVPADVQYTQAPGAPKVTVSGPERLVSDLEIDGGAIRFAHHRHGHWGGDLTIVMSAPSVTRFELDGSGKLNIAAYKQDKLDVQISGSGDVSVAGETGAVDLNISGSGDADFAALKARSADVDINGSGSAKLAPSDAAKVDISGSGEVTLLSHPPKLDTSISGSGSLHQEGGASVTPSPSPSPTPSPTPSPPKKAGKKT
ncbi:MAG TPA: DUF2807 domain-containing protein [Phenylobacterium sp.]|jgi:hypothetical protein